MICTGTITRSEPSWLFVAIPLSNLPPGATVNFNDLASLLFHSTLTSYSPGFAASVKISPAIFDPSVSLRPKMFGKLHRTRAHFAFCGIDSST